MTSRKVVIEIGDSIGNQEKEAPVKEAERKILLFNYNISNFTNLTQFMLMTFAVFFCYVLYGLVLEKIFLIPRLKKAGLYLTFVQFILYTLLAKGEMKFVLSANQPRRIPIKTYVLLAIVSIISMSLSNASLGYLNYPIQVVFKSCKLIPVLLGSFFIQKKVIKSMDFFAACLMCLGLIIFTLADSNVSPNFNPLGIIMLSVALIADAIMSNVQEKFMKSFNACNAEVIFYSYSIGSVLSFVYILMTGDLISGINAFGENAYQSYGMVLVFSITGYFGMQAVLSLVRTFGAFVAVTVTSMRKAVSVVISFILFSKPFTIQYLFGGTIVIFGIYLNLASKRHVDVIALTSSTVRKVMSWIFQKPIARFTASHV